MSVWLRRRKVFCKNMMMRESVPWWFDYELSIRTVSFGKFI